MKKSRYNKSEIMKRAWKIFRSGHSFYSISFGVALGRAWEIAKEAKTTEARKTKEQAWTNTMSTAAESSIVFDMNMIANSLRSYYANNTYNGD